MAKSIVPITRAGSAEPVATRIPIIVDGIIVTLEEFRAKKVTIALVAVSSFLFNFLKIKFKIFQFVII